MKRKKAPGRSATNSLVVGFAWYDEAQWNKLKQVADDVDALDDSYEEWLQGAEETERKLRRQGVPVRRVNIDIDELSKWCKSRGLPLNSTSRADYASAVMVLGKKP